MQAYFVMCAWRVDQMVDHLNVSYLYKKRGVFYFTKRVPCDVKSYYRSLSAYKKVRVGALPNELICIVEKCEYNFMHLLHKRKHK